MDSNEGAAPSVRLGGAWKVAQERRAALEGAVAALQGELAGVRALLQRSEAARARAEASAAHAARSDALRALRVAALAHRAEDERQARKAAEAREAEAFALADECRRELKQTTASLVAGDRRFHELRLVSEERLAALTAARRECDEVQRQFDTSEAARERAEEEARAQAERADALGRARDHKDKHLCLLIKERDRAMDDLAAARKELSKGRGFVRRAFPSAAFGGGPSPSSPSSSSLTPPVSVEAGTENVRLDPNVVMDRATEKNAEHELTKLAGFAAPNRLKERLAGEVAMRKAAELEVRRRLAGWLVAVACGGDRMCWAVFRASYVSACLAFMCMCVLG
jgi:hypothetical protein